MIRCQSGTDKASDFDSATLVADIDRPSHPGERYSGVGGRNLRCATNSPGIDRGTRTDDPKPSADFAHPNCFVAGGDIDITTDALQSDTSGGVVHFCRTFYVTQNDCPVGIVDPYPLR